MHRSLFVLALSTAVAALAPRLIRAESAPAVDLSQAAVFEVGKPSGPARQAVPLLLDEVAKRLHASWRQVAEWPGDRSPLVIVGHREDAARLADAKGLKLPWDLASAFSARLEGYWIGA